MTRSTPSPARSLWIRVTFGATAALVSVLAIPIPAPAPARLGAASALAVGTAVGTLLFVALARARPRLPRPDQLTATQFCFLIGWAGVEEALWRRLLLGGVAAIAGAVAGLITATILFASAHPGSRLTQVITGTAFGAAYLSTGRLGTAVASHAVYNLLVAGFRTRPRTAT